MGTSEQNPPEKSANNKFFVCTYNVRTLHTEERIIQMEQALKNVKWDVIGVAETRTKENNIEERNWCIYCHTTSTKGQHGVGFLVKKEYKNNIEEFIEISDRIAILNLKLNNIKYR